MDKQQIDEKARRFFETLWEQGDPWQFETSEFERARYARLLSALEGRRYRRALEVGCGAGSFSGLLSRIVDDLVAIDISSTAVARARRTVTGPGRVEFRVANIMEYDPRSDGPWDLIVMSETIYYLGWLYSFFDVGWLAAELFASTRDDGRLLLANTLGELEDALLLPWLIRSYRDLFLNVGYQLVSEDLFRGAKTGVTLEVLVSLFAKDPQATKKLQQNQENNR